MNVLADANAWLQSQRHTHTTRDVTYQRGAGQLSIKATVGRTKFESERLDGVRVVDESRDFLIRAVDLDFGLGPVEPERGDLVIEGGKTYEVLPFGKNDEHWRYSDRDRLTFRVYTKGPV